MQASCSLKAGLWPRPIGLVQRSAATWRCGLHSSPRALVTTVVSRVVLRRVRNCRSYYYCYEALRSAISLYVMLLLQVAPQLSTLGLHAFTIAMLSANVCVCIVLQIITMYRCTTQKQTLSLRQAIFISKSVSKFMLTYPAGLPSYIIHLFLPSYLYFKLYLFPHSPTPSCIILLNHPILPPH